MDDLWKPVVGWATGHLLGTMATAHCREMLFGRPERVFE